MNDEAVYRTAPATPGLLNRKKSEQDFKAERKLLLKNLSKLKAEKNHPRLKVSLHRT